MMTGARPEAALLVGAAKSVWAGGTALVTIQIEVSEKLRERLGGEGITPLESVFITDSDIRHIRKRHASDEKRRGQPPVTPDDFSVIPDVLCDFDSFEHTDTDKLGNKKFLLTKLVGDEYYVVTIQRGKRKLEVKTMWKRRPGASC